jgi:acetyl esterase/lipase
MTNDLDPQISALLDLVAKSGVPELNTLPPEQAREQYLLNVKKIVGETPKIRKTIDRTIDSPEGELPIRIYWPDIEQADKLPVLVFFHGGGWSIGSIESHDHVCRWLTANSECIVVSVEYRMGPEHKFPAAVEDAMTATEWAIRNATEIGADAGRIGIGGDSAGANLATVVSILMRDKNISAIKTQLLIYPATDMSMSHASHKLFGEGYRLTRPLMVWSVANYLRDGRDMLDFRASPLLAKDLSNLPPALIMTAGFDPLRDEGEAYANKLRESGVAVKYVCYEGMIHGFIGMPNVVDTSKTALLDSSAYLKEMLYS